MDISTCDLKICDGQSHHWDQAGQNVGSDLDPNCLSLGQQQLFNYLSIGLYIDGWLLITFIQTVWTQIRQNVIYVALNCIISGNCVVMYHVVGRICTSFGIWWMHWSGCMVSVVLGVCLLDNEMKLHIYTTYVNGRAKTSDNWPITPPHQ